MHSCDGCVYYNKKEGSCRREYDPNEARIERRPNGVMRFLAWLRKLLPERW